MRMVVPNFVHLLCPETLAVCGYRDYVDWIVSTSFELMLLAALQDNAPTVSGMKAVRRRIKLEAGTLVRRLRFHMVVRKGRSRIANQ